MPRRKRYRQNDLPTARSVSQRVNGYIRSLKEGTKGPKLPPLNNFRVFAPDQEVDNYRTVMNAYSKWYLRLVWGLTPKYTPSMRNVGLIPKALQMRALLKNIVNKTIEKTPAGALVRPETVGEVLKSLKVVKTPPSPNKIRPVPKSPKTPIKPPLSMQHPVAAAAAPPAKVKVFTNLRDFRFSAKDVTTICKREDQSIHESYAVSWILSPSQYTREEFSVWHPEDIRRYFVADDKQGFAVGAVLDPKKFGNKLIFYVILICSAEKTRGVGTQLMKAVVQEATRLKCDRIWLAALEDRTLIYQKWGFVFGPYYQENDPLSRLDGGRRTSRIFSEPFRATGNGNKPSSTLPRPSILYTISGLHSDLDVGEGYLMTYGL